MVALIVQDLRGQKRHGEWTMFFYECDVALVSRATSPASCTIGAAQLLANSVVVPSTR
jgi:hypothetical protein